MTATSLPATDRPLKITSSVCPVCKAHLPATVVQRGDAVFLCKTCPTHGPFEAQISSDARWYHLSLGADAAGESGSCCGGSGCCGPDDAGGLVGLTSGGGSGHDETIIERSSTCIALIEIVETCNLECPTCYAGSAPPPGSEEHVALSLDEFRGRMESVIARKGLIDILQLSGGEPTVHPDFFELLEWSLTHDKIGYVLLNTNGVRLANEPAFMDKLADLHRRLRKFEVYLQYDGPQESGQTALRGLDLRKVRQRVVDQCHQRGVPVTLAMTVDEHNRGHLGETVRFALENKAVRGITFQPMFGSGRAYDGVNLTVNGEARFAPLPLREGLGEGRPKDPMDQEDINQDRPSPQPPPSEGGGAGTQAAGITRPPTERLSVADMVLGLIDQSDGLLSAEDFTPLPCGDPNCHTVGYVVRRGQEAVGVSSMVDLESMQGFLKDRINFDLDDLAKCGCESEELGAVLKHLEVGPDDVLRLFIKPFMDVWTYDQHRIDRCCVHVVGEGGKLESFCRHYAMQ